MPERDDATPRARRLSEPLAVWGNVQTWKAMRVGRFVHLDVGDAEITVTAGDGASEPVTEVVQRNEDPSAAAMRAILRVGQR